MKPQTPGQTLAQKLVARAAGRASVTPGEIVTCKVDLAMMHDSGGPRRVKPMLERLGAKVWDPEKIVVITDHYLPANDDESKQIIATARDWVKDAGVKRFYDGIGICHVVLPEQGHLRPGCSSSAATAIRPPAARSARTCSASARPRCSACSSPARSG